MGSQPGSRGASPVTSGELAAQQTWLCFQLLNRSKDTENIKILFCYYPLRRIELQGNRITVLDADTIIYRITNYTIEVLGNPGTAKPFHIRFTERFSLSFNFSSLQPICIWFATLGHVLYFSGCHIH